MSLFTAAKIADFFGVSLDMIRVWEEELAERKPTT
jgi:DNA-binding transcriptional regulator YiaG